MRKKVLIIPHSAVSGISIRIVEIAEVLSEHYETYVLSWNEPVRGTVVDRVKVSLKDFLKGSRVYRKNGAWSAEYSFLHRPLSLVPAYNRYSLGKFIIENEIDVVINSVHYFFPTPHKERHNYRHIFDLNDLPAVDAGGFSGSFMEDFARTEILKADAVTACSRGLADYVQDRFSCNPHYIPNGTHLDNFRSADMDEANRIRGRYGLSDKFIIGYIGYAGDWIDLDLLINAFRGFRNTCGNAALMIVGGGPRTEFYKNNIRDKDIIFTGAVARDRIKEYFFSIDAGVVPSKLSLFQDVAFHIKLIEYTAARKPVISSPLKEVKRLGLPNVRIADLQRDKWVTAMHDVKQMKWDHAWDTFVAEYDWRKIGNRYIDIIEGQYA